MKFKIFIILLIFSSFCYADKIEIHDGNIYDGIILEATEQHVKIQVNDSLVKRISHSDIKSIFFTYADVVYLLSKESIKCKILEEIYPQLKVITSEGIQYYRYNDIKRYFYNESDSLYISSLPPTTYIFNNEKLELYKKSDFSKNIFAGIRGGFNSIKIEKWEEKFLSPDAALGFEGGIKVGYTFSEDINITIGYEYGNYKNTIQGDLESSFNTNFIYISPGYVKKFIILYVFYTGLALDIGLFNATGDLYLYSYRKVELDNQAFNLALRPKIVCRFPISKMIILDFDAGYFFAESNEINIPESSIANFPVSFNGVSFKLSVCYQFPYSF